MSWSKDKRGGKRSLTYANVASTIAIFVALGGSSYAALTLPPDSVGANQIRAGAVDSRDIQDGAIQPAHLSRRLAGELASALVPEHLGGALAGTPFVPPRGNNACARWAPGISGCIEVAGNTKSLAFLDSHTWTLKCPPGYEFVVVSPDYSLSFPVPAYTIDTTAGTYTGAASVLGGFFTATNWTLKSHRYTPHTACVKSPPPPVVH